MLNPFRQGWLSIVSICVVLVQIAVVTVLFIYLKHDENRHVRSVNARTSARFVNVMNEQLQNLYFLNHRNAELFRLNGPEISFDNYVLSLQLPLDQSSAEVEAYEFIPRIAQADVAAFNHFCSTQINPTCFLKELNRTVTPILNTQSVFQPVTLNRTYYYPILYIYPISTEYAFVNNIQGFDHLSRKEGVDIVSQFSPGATSTVTRQAHVVVPTANPYASYGVLIAQSVYSNENATHLTGYAVMVIRLATIIEKSLSISSFTHSNVQISMFDATIDGITEIAANNLTILYKENTQNYHNVWQPSDVHKFSNKGNVEFLNRQYVFFFTYSRQYEQGLRTQLPLIVPIVMIGVFCMLNLIAVLLIYLYRQRLSHLDGARAKQMLAYTSHEIRNPLNVIKGIVDYTLRTIDQIPTPVGICRADLTIVARTCDFLEHIVSDILVLQLLEENRLTLDIKPCHLKKVFDDIMESTVQKMEENKRVTLHMECTDQIVLQADEFRLKQVILNLLTNSIKYTTVGSITVKAEVEHESDSVLITVKDTGVGIAENRKHLIFQVQKQTDVKEIGRHGSYGMGLYLVRILSKRMSWAIGFESKLGDGSTFWVRIPNHSAVPSKQLPAESTLSSHLNERSVSGHAEK